MIILGVDPGVQITGYAVLKTEKKSTEILKFGCIKTDSSKSFDLRLKKIYDGISNVVSEFELDFLVLEEVFYSRNVKIALKMGHVRGVTLLAAANYNVSTAEYSPREVKQSVTGNGNASKHQVQQMIIHLLKLTEAPSPFDITDAMAIAYCHYIRYSTKKRLANFST